MKKLMKTGMMGLALLTVVTLGVKAQSADNKDPQRPRLLLSVGPEAGLPLGDFKDGYDWSLGGSIQADYAILKRDLYVTLNAGFDNYFAKDISNAEGFEAKDLRLIPVKAGLKYYPVKNFYVQAQAGAAFITDKKDVFADKSAAFVYAPQVGYLFHLGRGSYLDAGIKFEGNSRFADGGKSNNLLGLRVAYAFGL